MPDEQEIIIAKSLFPISTGAKWNRMPIDVSRIPLFTKNKLQRANNRFRERKAPGLDELPPVAIKKVVEQYNTEYLDLMNRLHLAGEFPKVWNH